METTIEQKNKLIDEFLKGYNKGEIYFYPEHGTYVTSDGKYEEYFTVDELKFHSSWDWLMPVFVKLKRIIVPFGEANSQTRSLERLHDLQRLSGFILTGNVGKAHGEVYNMVLKYKDQWTQ